jgi:membrane associated rhomboid family serine protease
MTTTPVGMRCPECAKQGTKVMRLRDMAAAPRVAYALVAANIVVFFTEQGQFTISGNGIYGKVINEGFLDREAIHVGHQYWRLVSAGFLHENLLHIGFNMYLLYLLGRMLEPAIGSLRFAAVYITALLCGSLGALIATAGPTLGASGAVFGLMGAMVVELRARRLSVMESGIGGLIVLNLIISFTFANISVGDHIGGLIGGALAGLALRSAGDRYKAFGLLACVALSVVAVAASVAVAGASGSGFA